MSSRLHFARSGLCRPRGNVVLLGGAPRGGSSAIWTKATSSFRATLIPSSWPALTASDHGMSSSHMTGASAQPRTRQGRPPREATERRQDIRKPTTYRLQSLAPAHQRVWADRRPRCRRHPRPTHRRTSLRAGSRLRPRHRMPCPNPGIQPLADIGDLAAGLDETAIHVLSSPLHPGCPDRSAVPASRGISCHLHLNSSIDPTCRGSMLT